MSPFSVFSKICKGVKKALKRDATIAAARFFQKKIFPSQSTSYSTSCETWHSFSHTTSSSGCPSHAPDPTFGTTFCVRGCRGTVTLLLETFPAADKPIKPGAIRGNLQSVLDWLSDGTSLGSQSPSTRINMRRNGPGFSARVVHTETW